MSTRAERANAYTEKTKEKELVKHKMVKDREYVAWCGAGCYSYNPAAADWQDVTCKRCLALGKSKGVI